MPSVGSWVWHQLTHHLTAASVSSLHYQLTCICAQLCHFVQLYTRESSPSLNLLRHKCCWFAPLLCAPLIAPNAVTWDSLSQIYLSPCLWNQLPLSLRQPYSGTSSSISCSPIPSPVTSSSSDSPLCTSITPSLFHSRLKTYLFHKSYRRSFTSSSRTAFTDYCPDRFFWATRFLFLCRVLD